MSKKCIGCGAVLQNTDKNKNGYTPKLENKYCMRCFRIANYGDFTATRPEKDNEKISGKVLRLANREDIDIQLEEHLIVELYSK